MNKTHWKKLHNPDYLGAYALDPGQELIVTIQSVKNELVACSDGKKEECTVARFRESGVKPMILNKTNAKTIEKMHKSPYIEDWSGKKIQIYAEQVKAFGEVVDALRIRPRAPSGRLPELNPEHEKWDGAVASVRAGTIGVDGIRKHYSLSPENEEKLFLQAGIESGGA